MDYSSGFQVDRLEADNRLARFKALAEAELALQSMLASSTENDEWARGRRCGWAGAIDVLRALAASGKQE